MLTRPNTARPLRIVIDPSALAHNLSRLRHARGGRPPRSGPWPRPMPTAMASPSAGGAGRGGRPGRARCRRGLARDRPGLARPHPGSGRIVRPARSRPSPRHVARPGGRRHGPAGLACLGPPRGRRPSGCAGRATWAMPASMPATIPTPIAAPRRWPPGTRIGGRPSAALRERRGSRQALSVRPRLRPGDRRPARPVSRSNSAALLTARRADGRLDPARPGALRRQPLAAGRRSRSACGR